MSWKMARPTASGPPWVSASLRSSRRFSRRFVELLAEVAGVGHAVGEHGDDVAGVELDLGLLVVRLGDDPQREAGDLLADLLDRPIGPADQDRQMSGRGRASTSASTVSSTLRLSVMNFSSIPAAKSRLFSSLAAAEGEFSVRMQ